MAPQGKSGKHSDDDDDDAGEYDKNVTGEGQLVLAMMVEFVKHLKPVYGFTISPSLVSYIATYYITRF